MVTLFYRGIHLCFLEDPPDELLNVGEEALLLEAAVFEDAELHTVEVDFEEGPER